VKKDGADLSRHWLLDPDITFLNHGSFGACPSPVLDAQLRLREQMEREPVRFMTQEAPQLLADARENLGAFVGASPEGLAFVSNATTGLNAVLRSMPLAAGDELLVTDHEYNASRNVLEHVAASHGARVAVISIPFPVTGADQIFEAVLNSVTTKTRLALLDHVTSSTALVLPMRELIRELEARGVAVLVDGAHAPGMLALEIDALAPSYYAGNCHKWICAPKGAGFLWVREDRRESVRPAVISHGANAPVPRSERFRVEFDWMGTADPSAALAVPDAIRFLGSLLPGGWDEIRERNHALALEGRRVLADALDVEMPCPDEMIGSMAAIALPASARFPIPENSHAFGPNPLHDALLREHRIEVPLLLDPCGKTRLVRVSAQLYNTRDDYERLAAALLALL
jgi:isopenicillin-N epimerase